jgi:hypothetical protein
MGIFRFVIIATAFLLSLFVSISLPNFGSLDLGRVVFKNGNNGVAGARTIRVSIFLKVSKDKTRRLTNADLHSSACGRLPRMPVGLGENVNEICRSFCTNLNSTDANPCDAVSPCNSTALTSTTYCTPQREFNNNSDEANFRLNIVANID